MAPALAHGRADGTAAGERPAEAAGHQRLTRGSAHPGRRNWCPGRRMHDRAFRPPGTIQIRYLFGTGSTLHGPSVQNCARNVL